MIKLIINSNKIKIIYQNQLGYNFLFSFLINEILLIFKICFEFIDLLNNNNYKISLKLKLF